MPRIEHVIETAPSGSFRAAKVAGMFDIPPSEKLRKEWVIDAPFEEREWQVGLIVGASGSGKSTIAGQLFGDSLHQGFQWQSKCLLDDFPKDCEVSQITEILSKVGFSSPPQWLLPYSALSTGQKFRVELARCLLEYKGLVVFDEFTSVVDRQVAQIGSFAFQKAVRKSGRQFVAVTCHYDVEPWLQPDWVLDMSTGEFRWGCLRRPEIQLEIFRCHHSAWRYFAEYHYLSADISKAAVCFVGCIDGRPVSFCAWIPFLGRLKGSRKAMRAHRVVTIPDFQGLGVGGRLLDCCASMWAGIGKRAFVRTAHSTMARSLASSGKWKMIGKPSRTASDRIRKTASDRITAGFEWAGEIMDKSDALSLIG